MSKKANLLMLVIIVVLILVSIFSVGKKNDLENKVIDLNGEIKQLQAENKTLQNTSDSKDKNTFDEDINWFVTKVYTLENRKKLYEEIKESATDEVLTLLLGDKLPPDENQGEVESIDRKVSNIEIYGKYLDDKHFKSIVTLDLKFGYEDKSDSAFTVLQVDLTKKESGWKISKFKEYAKGGN